MIKKKFCENIRGLTKCFWFSQKQFLDLFSAENLKFQF